MQEFDDGIQPNRNDRLPSVRPAYLPAIPAAEVPAEGGDGITINLPRMLRKYILLTVCLAILGGAVGCVSVALTPPIYGGRALLEVQATTAGSFIKSSGPDNGDINVNIQTQTSILQSSSFLTRVAERLQLETIPPSSTSVRYLWTIAGPAANHDTGPVGSHEAGCGESAWYF